MGLRALVSGFEDDHLDLFRDSRVRTAFDQTFV